MRKFTTSCIDNETGMEMILSECSYNMSCDYLMRNGFTDYDKFESDVRYVTMTFSRPAQRTFVYDEVRGILLGN